MPEKAIRPAILSGGAGTRLWPLSRRGRPKQFLHLLGEHSLFQQTCLRFTGALFSAPLILGNAEHRFLIAEQLQQIGIVPTSIVLEPVTRNTAPAALTAALTAADEDPDALILLSPSDHIISDAAALAEAIGRGRDAAKAGSVVLFGIRPDGPRTEYGYIELAGGPGPLHGVRRFIEKPDAETAHHCLADGNFCWNSGLFLFSATAMLEAFAAHAPAFLVPCKQALEKADADPDFLRLDVTDYAKAPSLSLDHALIEKTGGLRCVPLDTGWSDLGSWPSIWEAFDKDDAGNAVHGDVRLSETHNSLAYSDAPCLSLLGLNNVVAVATRDAVIMASRERAEEIGTMAEGLASNGHVATLESSRVSRPWGWFERLSQGEGFQVKRLRVNAGGTLSLQSHVHRREYWIVIQGRVEVIVGEEKRILEAGQSAFIPTGARHRLANIGNTAAFLIEVQAGSYLGEDDIIRFDDAYGRLTPG